MMKELTCIFTGNLTKDFLHNSRLIDQFNEIKFTKITNLTKDWTQIACLAVSHSVHYTRMFSMLVWSCNQILSMHGWLCPFHLIGWKYLHFEIKLDWLNCVINVYHELSTQNTTEHYLSNPKVQFLLLHSRRNSKLQIQILYIFSDPGCM